MHLMDPLDASMLTAELRGNPMHVAGRDAVPDVEALIPHTEAALAALEEALRS